MLYLLIGHHFARVPSFFFALQLLCIVVAKLLLFASVESPWLSPLLTVSPHQLVFDLHLWIKVLLQKVPLVIQVMVVVSH